MKQVNVEDLSRGQLEDIVIQQSKMLQIQQLKIESLEKSLEESESHCETLGNVVLQARQILSC